jgi:hypothetical protein
LQMRTTMNEIVTAFAAPRIDRYARCIEASKRVRWDIDADVIRGRRFDVRDKFLPDGLSKVAALDFLSDDEKRFLGQVQGRTYANMFGLVERFIAAKVMEVSQDHMLGDQVKLEALVRFTDEELKHQALFRRVERLAAEAMPAGYVFGPEPNAVAAVVLGKSTWAVLCLTLLIELFTQAHYRDSIAPDHRMSPLYKDIFLFHWKEESQHAIMDELEWRRHDATLSDAARDRAVDEFIELAVAVDGILQAQSAADADYFAANCGRSLGADEKAAVEAGVLGAYRYQYILSGAVHPHFQKVLGELTTEAQRARIEGAVASLA